MAITKETPLKEVLEIGTECKMCGQCCKHTSGFLIGDDLKNIAKHLEMLPEDVKKQFMEEVQFYNKTFIKPKTLPKENGMTGQCVFLGEKNDCKIQDVKPLQCRVCKGCDEKGKELFSWFLLNYCVDENKPETIRQYVHYLRSGGKVIPGGRLKDLIKDEEMLNKVLGMEVFDDRKIED